jgi:hypothetical protein
MLVGEKERHRTERIGWLRAAVLGANDGILSTSSIVLGVAAAHATHSNVLVAGVAVRNSCRKRALRSKQLPCQTLSHSKSAASIALYPVSRLSEAIRAPLWYTSARTPLSVRTLDAN